MELRALRYFVAVADELHFGRAAERLHIAQPAVSQQIARLERELGVRLLDRSPRRVRLTAAGQRVLDAARSTLAAAGQVAIAAKQVPTIVRIGTAAGLTARLERGIDALRERAPEFDVVLVDLPVEARLNALRQGDLDLALTRGVGSVPGLTVLPAWTENLLAVVSKHHPAADRSAVGLAELAGDTLRLPAREHDPPLHDAVGLALRETGLCPRAGRPTGTLQDTIVEVGSDSRSWTVLPADQAAEIHSTRVRAIPLEPAITITGGVVVAEDAGSAAECAVAAFRDEGIGHRPQETGPAAR
ncbi:LysR family transcriptional regulator [Amycolatopsis sp. DG1A-15b]|uniref:LysR family transcriptional regulator n=1 Tax=Amycolatopsis sp. DG1A-15b TaxID=3052846 RepID=UPI00255B9956|nr:LysR family transcriptional regulator [Amycolatopsis sp. DG1A-15b]WIX88209.1 LysR family transcriptional regulator [Amycolatopsis sp. DG1A-15b]